MRFDEYRSHDAVGLAALVAKREVSADELLDTAVARMAEVNPKINAVTRDMTDLARGAPAGSGPLAGVGERHSGWRLVPDAGLEPATFGLQNRCSTS